MKEVSDDCGEDNQEIGGDISVFKTGNISKHMLLQDKSDFRDAKYNLTS
jgi:hypothetical protein